jgi:Ca-activated chloride channel family protein
LSFAYPWLALLLPLSVLVFRLPAPHEESRPAVRVPFFGLLVSPPCLVSVSTSPIDW